MPLLCAVSLTAVVQARADAQYHRYGGVLSLKRNGKGWFHVELIGGRWYCLTPEGHAFFSLGAAHAVECMRQDALDLFEPKDRTSEPRLAEFFLAKFKECSYDASGNGPLPTMERRIP